MTTSIRYMYGQNHDVINEYADGPIPRILDHVWLKVSLDRLPPKAITREADGKAYLRVKKVVHDPDARMVRVTVWPVLGPKTTSSR